MKTTKCHVPELRQAMSGCKKITPGSFKKQLVDRFMVNGEGSFLSDDHRRFVIEDHVFASCTFAKIEIPPQIYTFADEALKRLHGKYGFCIELYEQRTVLDPDWRPSPNSSSQPDDTIDVIDYDTTFLGYYELFSDEIIIFPRENVKLRRAHPLFQSTLMAFILHETEACTYRRIFKIRGKRLTAIRDCLLTDDKRKCFEPMHFVYNGYDNK